MNYCKDCKFCEIKKVRFLWKKHLKYLCYNPQCYLLNPVDGKLYNNLILDCSIMRHGAVDYYRGLGFNLCGRAGLFFELKENKNPQNKKLDFST